jgi:hypothetical protein
VSASAPEDGQALVETAIVMPLFVFLLLGTIQLALMHQAHMLTTYAAYKAVRAGSLSHADHDIMTNAATAALLPMISWQRNGVEKIMPVSSATKYVEKMLAVRALALADAPVEVTICGPVKKNVRSTTGIDPVAKRNTGEVQFDAPMQIDKSDWLSFDRTKLRIEVTFNYRMPIPFANMIIYQIARGQENADLMLITRLGDKGLHKLHEARLRYDAMARAGLGYTLPIRASYTMRMMSDLYPDKSGYALPTENLCHFSFAKKGGE